MKDSKILTPKFFNKPILEICPRLLGNLLVQKNNNSIHYYTITEIEAYDGLNDLASHARFGITNRNAPMFGPPGHFYTYLIYGMYWMLNIVTGPQNYPAAILIRGTKEIKGPGRLTKKLNINKKLNNKIASPSTGLWFELNNINIDKKQIKKAKRIGVNYAGPIWSKKKYRFILNL